MIVVRCLDHRIQARHRTQTMAHSVRQTFQLNMPSSGKTAKWPTLAAWEAHAPVRKFPIFKALSTTLAKSSVVLRLPATRLFILSFGQRAAKCRTSERSEEKTELLTRSTTRVRLLDTPIWRVIRCNTHFLGGLACTD